MVRIVSAAHDRFPDEMAVWSSPIWPLAKTGGQNWGVLVKAPAIYLSAALRQRGQSKAKGNLTEGLGSPFMPYAGLRSPR
jgi:hypothetical protein